MRTRARKNSVWLILASCCLALSGALAAQTIEIQVSPNVLNLQNSGEVVTIHTDIAYSAVAASTVTLNGVTVLSTKLDNQGNFVAKFDIEDIKNLPLNVGEYNTLTLEGMTTDNQPFTGSKSIMVVNVIPKGR